MYIHRVSVFIRTPRFSRDAPRSFEYMKYSKLAFKLIKDWDREEICFGMVPKVPEDINILKELMKD